MTRPWRCQPGCPASSRRGFATPTRTRNPPHKCFVLIDVNPARPAELFPLCDELAVLVEDLDPVVVPVADEQPAFGIHRERVRLVELAGSGPQLAPGLDQLPIPGELENAIVSAAVSFGDE